MKKISIFVLSFLSIVTVFLLTLNYAYGATIAPIYYGGTGATNFGQGWLYSIGGVNALQSSSSPTVAKITATSTATSTFAGGLSTKAISTTNEIKVGGAMIATGAVSGSNLSGTNSGDLSLHSSATAGGLSLAGQVLSLATSTLKTALALVKADVGLGNVSNTAQVTSVSGTAPIASSGGLTPAISLNNAGVTLAKLANLAYGTIIGRSTNSTGVPEAISTSTYKSMLALTKTDVGLGNVSNTAQVTAVTASGLLASSGGTTPALTMPLTSGFTVVGNASNVASATPDIFVDSAHNVGIGTTSPLVRLHVVDYNDTGSGIWQTFENTSVTNSYAGLQMYTGGVRRASVVGGTESLPWGSVQGMTLSAGNSSDSIAFKIGPGVYSGSANGPAMILRPSGYVGIGANNPAMTLEVNGGVRLFTSSSTPTCVVARRGTLWFVSSAAGVKDILQVCAKDASNAYAWRTLY